MHTLMKNLMLAYGAGTLGGLANFAFGLILATTGVFAALGIHLPPSPQPAGLYQRLVWGGIWGALLFLPISGSLLLKGFLLGVPPSLVAGLLVFPSKGAGMFGVSLGKFFPVMIFLFNWVWGIATVAAGRWGGLR